ncbi:MAG: VOC family protein [Halococcoides sp.]
MTDEPVTADPPDSPFRTTGVDHVTIWGSNAEDTIAFYRDLLGMPLVLRQPNLDDRRQTHLFFDIGDGRLLTVFVNPERESNRGRQLTPTGGVHHLAFSVDPAEFEDVLEALDEAGHGYNVFDRGIFYSAYTTDHNGLVIELATDKYDVPADRRGEVLAKTQQLREDAGAEFAREEDLEAALAALDIDASAADLPDAATGADTR